MIELFGDSSGDLTSEKFHPGWFLLQHHHATTLEDLKAGLAYLRRKVNSQKEGQLSFLKVNKPCSSNMLLMQLYKIVHDHEVTYETG